MAPLERHLDERPAREVASGLPPGQCNLKRFFDLVVSLLLLTPLLPVILLSAWAASRATGASGFFFQERVGRDGRTFRVVKLRTMRPVAGSTVTSLGDPRITSFGRLLRASKLDELPQLFNVLAGQMSLVGPRPDVPGFADLLSDEERLILSIRPGITGPATLKYRNEEKLLASVADPERYNREVIYPDKVRLNLDYVRHWSFTMDLVYLWRTIFPTPNE